MKTLIWNARQLKTWPHPKNTYREQQQYYVNLDRESPWLPAWWDELRFLRRIGFRAMFRYY